MGYKEAEGLCSDQIQLPDGRIMRRRTDHIRDQCLVNLALNIQTILIMMIP